ncbi:MAG: YiiX family permuted papain-like enzyme [Flavobacteriales bacterium]|nr:YiiX family permuted papain-like enzyme [Flavobacteriales bacterium]
MKKQLLCKKGALILAMLLAFINIATAKYNYKSGDIIFQTDQSHQSKAVQLATHSRFSHVGIIFNTAEGIMVYEAVQPVRITPINEWIKGGKGGAYVVRRLKNSENILTKAAVQKMKAVGDKYLGKDYDAFFEWSDSRIYCSELVWKIYKKALGLEIGELQELRSFDLKHKEVQRIMNYRYGDNIPYNEKVISPEAMFKSNLLITVGGKGYDL